MMPGRLAEKRTVSPVVDVLCNDAVQAIHLSQSAVKGPPEHRATGYRHGRDVTRSVSTTFTHMTSPILKEAS